MPYREDQLPELAPTPKQASLTDMLAAQLLGDSWRISGGKLIYQNPNNPIAVKIGGSGIGAAFPLFGADLDANAKYNGDWNLNGGYAINPNQNLRFNLGQTDGNNRYGLQYQWIFR